jgi:MoaA/NifB/PqqE/SkfB family radical SAM enzyme
MSLACSKGGVYPLDSDLAGVDIPIVRWWREVGYALTGQQLYERLRTIAKPIQVEIGIGNTCGLNCQHCFLGYESGTMSNALTPMPTLLETITRMIEDLGTRLICVTDRDALTPQRSIPLFEYLARYRRQDATIKFGGVTNGLRIEEFADDLERIQLDYLDISIDGDRHDHDQIRGLGRYDQVLSNLKTALQRNIADRLIVAMTLTRFNDDSIIRTIHNMIAIGVQWFDIGPLMAVKMQEYQLHETDLVEFLESLFASLQPLQITQTVTLLVELCAYCAAFLPALFDRGWLVLEQIRQDQYGHLYQEIRVNANITLVLRPELIPEYWRHALRITADGYVVGGCEPLTQDNYSHFAVGNIQTESIAALYQKAIAPASPFHQSTLAYDRSSCRGKPCFTHCLGGDALLARSVYGNYHRKDPNCTWHEYTYRNQAGQSCQLSTSKVTQPIGSLSG